MQDGQDDPAEVDIDVRPKGDTAYDVVLRATGQGPLEAGYSSEDDSVLDKGRVG